MNRREVLLASGMAAPLIFWFSSSEAPAADLCRLLTREQAAKALGASVQPGVTAGPLGSACQWDQTDGDGYLQVQVVEPRYWVAPARAPNYKKLTGIGKDAYVVPELDGFSAGALTSKNFVVVSLSGGTASPEKLRHF